MTSQIIKLVRVKDFGAALNLIDVNCMDEEDQTQSEVVRTKGVLT